MRLINADTFANHFCEMCNQEGCEGCYENENMKCDMRKLLEIALEDAPVVEPKKGKWVKTFGTYGDICCSECGETNIETNFCPYCGADMREDNNGETD